MENVRCETEVGCPGRFVRNLQKRTEPEKGETMKQCNAVIFFLLLCPLADGATDPFDEDPTQNPVWELYEPVAGAQYSIVDGWWRVTLPPGVNLDTWTTVDRGLQLRRSDFPEDFVIETRMRILGSGDPEDPVFPPVNESYLANLMIYFSTFDLFHFGPQRGTGIVLQRCGTPHLCTDVDPGLQELSLQVKKVGSKYTFSWRQNDTDPWNLFCTQIVDEELFPPVYVGLIFKTWNPLPTVSETFEFDYFTVKEVANEPPSIELPCEFGEPDTAWIGMPYVRPIAVEGYPLPEVLVKEGPADLFFEARSNTLTGWTPMAPGDVAIALEAKNAEGSASVNWTVRVSPDPKVHDEEFDVLPTENPDYWELYEPQKGVVYSIIEEPGSSWWRLEVPLQGDLGQNFDTWTGSDRAPQLRHLLEDPQKDFVIETKLRFDPVTAPAPTDPFLMGLLVYFSRYDIMHFHAGFERMVGGEPKNVLLERSGLNNLLVDYYPDLLLGSEIRLRLEKKCSTYNAFWLGEDEEVWHYMGSYETDDTPKYVGLIMKTWQAGASFTVDVDYFDILEPEEPAEEGLFVRGDVNDDDTINIADAISLLGHLFGGAPAPGCIDAADANDDGAMNIADAISILGHLFGGEGPLPLPFPACGPDPTPDDLPVCVYSHCP